MLLCIRDPESVKRRNMRKEQPIFGVPLSLALERNRCHDGVEIPLVIRNCIMHVQETGLGMEGLYKVSGMKSKVQHARRLYNQREHVCHSDYDLPVTTSLLKLFLRDLPETLLTSKLINRFEEVASLKEIAQRGAELKILANKLPPCNRILLAWLIKHLDDVAAHEKQNKMNIQNLSLTLSQPMQMSQKLVAALLYHCDTVFSDTKLIKYIPPLTSSSPALPETADAIAEELKKQESLLGQIHQEMNAGFVTKQREELLWEVQRMITQLKRKLRSLERAVESNQRSGGGGGDEVDGGCGSSNNGSTMKAASVEEEPPLNLALQQQQSSPAPGGLPTSTELPDATPPAAVKHVVEAIIETVDGSASGQETLDKDSSSDHQASTSAEELALCLETEELLALAGQLQAQIAQEKAEVALLRAQIRDFGGSPSYCDFLLENCSREVCADGVEDSAALKQAVAESQVLQLQKRNLTQTIIEEQVECINLRVQLKLLQMAGS